jgi:ABC-2 type transport system permease protein
MLVALGMGLVISIAAKNQFVAGQIAIIITFLRHILKISP